MDPRVAQLPVVPVLPPGCSWQTPSPALISFKASINSPKPELYKGKEPNGPRSTHGLEQDPALVITLVESRWRSVGQGTLHLQQLLTGQPQ